ncbi:MAG: hypothetical protein M1834_005849 [Cirrosporium novae-zelandiae]|nr:MAG: hypothetical protein M1834_005849 [Cirrosporium novae-zelandiae]
MSSIPPNSTMLPHQQPIPPKALDTSGLDTLAEGSEYALQELNSSPLSPQQHHRKTIKSPPKNRQAPYPTRKLSPVGGRHNAPWEGQGKARTSDGSAPVRRRISRACDQCNQLRTKCDGKSPCAHCIEFTLRCEYARERKKRGKASRKEIAQQQAAAAAASTAGNEGPTSPDEASSDGKSSNATATSHTNFNGNKDEMSPSTMPAIRSLNILGGLPQPFQPTRPDIRLPGSNTYPSIYDYQPHATMSGHPPLENQGSSSASFVGQHNPNNSRQAPATVSMGGFGSIPDFNRTPVQEMGYSSVQMGRVTAANALQSKLAGQDAYGEGPFPLINPHDPQTTVTGFQYNGQGESPLPGFFRASPGAPSPGWLSLPSPSAGPYQPPVPNKPNNITYPVLQPLLPHLVSIIPQPLACDLLDLYFSSSSSAYMRPLSPYLLGYAFRKRSFLHPTRPRPSSPALLASMLWVAAQSSDAPFLTSPPSARGRVCQKLLELTIALLRPLVHSPAVGEAPSNYATSTVVNGLALGGFGVAMAGGDSMTAESGATGTVDDVATYLHLATVISASEYKAASLRWWNAAWSLARELKLGRELPENPTPDDQSHGDDVDADGEVDLDVPPGNLSHNPRPGPTNPLSNPRGFISEEEREERRRIWWTLYMMDRHLALCYNRPLFLLDRECGDLFQPMDDIIWQAGEVYTGNARYTSSPSSRYRRRGPPIECTGHSIFGYFLPLMTILGEIVDLYHSKSHPRYGIPYRNASEWDGQEREISMQLEQYGQSLLEFEARCNNSKKRNSDTAMLDSSSNDTTSPPTNAAGSRMTESMIQTKIVAAYGTHLMHVLFILLTGKWDPISLLDDNDLWISSQSFITATGHAVSAAEAINDILEYDPDLTFMPFFFGMYLLQGSFLLLLIADKLQGGASPEVVKACETIVRAHEACVVTLNTEYQRNFRKVMRSALAQVKGRIPEDFGEQEQRRREVLSLYRWTGDGTGLAL